MIAYVITTRFGLTPDGRLWNPNGALGYRFWTRYLDVYDEVRLLAQTVELETPPQDWHEATGPGVVAAPVPSVERPSQALFRLNSLLSAIRRHQSGEGALHLRVPNALANISWLVQQGSRPYGVEVAGDPLDSLARGAYVGPLRPLMRAWFRDSLRRQCRKAAAAAYVTESALQRRYPPGPDTYTTHFSSIDLKEEDIAARPRRPLGNNQTIRIAWVGTLNQLYKAPQILISAVAACIDQGLDLELVILGDGRFRADLEEETRVLGIAPHTRFAGQVPAGAEVRAELDAADLFVLASYQEGLPKAMIEAMARGLPCIGSTVGGIPELLVSEDLVPPGDVSALARKITEVVTSPNRMEEMAARNLRRARDHSLSRIRDRRISFYRHVHDQTASWLRRQITPRGRTA